MSEADKHLTNSCAEIMRIAVDEPQAGLNFNSRENTFKRKDGSTMRKLSLPFEFAGRLFPSAEQFLDSFVTLRQISDQHDLAARHILQLTCNQPLGEFKGNSDRIFATDGKETFSKVGVTSHREQLSVTQLSDLGQPLNKINGLVRVSEKFTELLASRIDSVIEVVDITTASLQCTTDER